MKPAVTLEQAKSIVDTKTAPRVTEEHIDSLIEDVDYLYSGTTTVCLITVRNGFRFIGTSTPADPTNYDKQVGERYAYENAFKQIWTHEGYLLREILFQAEQNS